MGFINKRQYLIINKKLLFKNKCETDLRKI